MAVLASFEEDDYREIVDYDDLYFDEHFDDDDCDDSRTLLFWFYWQPVITMIAVVTISVLYYWLLASSRRRRRGRSIVVDTTTSEQISRPQRAASPIVTVSNQAKEAEIVHIKRSLKQDHNFGNFDPISSPNKRPPHFEQQCIAAAEMHQREICADDFLQLSLQNDCLKDRNDVVLLQSREMALNSCAMMKSLPNDDESGVFEKQIEHSESAFANMQLLVNSERESEKHDQNSSDEEGLDKFHFTLFLRNSSSDERSFSEEKSITNDRDNNNVALFVVSSSNQTRHAQSDDTPNLESSSTTTTVSNIEAATAAVSSSSFDLEKPLLPLDDVAFSNAFTIVQLAQNSSDHQQYAETEPLNLHPESNNHSTNPIETFKHDEKYHPNGLATINNNSTILLTDSVVFTESQNFAKSVGILPDDEDISVEFFQNPPSSAHFQESDSTFSDNFYSKMDITSFRDTDSPVADFCQKPVDNEVQLAEVDSTKKTTTEPNSDDVEEKNTDNLSRQSELLLTVNNDNRTTYLNTESAEFSDTPREISSVNDVDLVEVEKIARKNEKMLRKITKNKHGEADDKNSTTNVGKKEFIQLHSVSSEHEKISSTDFPQSDELFIASKAALERSEKTNLTLTLEQLLFDESAQKDDVEKGQPLLTEVVLQQASSAVSSTQSVDDEKMKLHAKDKDTKFVMFHTRNSENNLQHSISTECSSTGAASTASEPTSDCMSCTDGRNLELYVVDCDVKKQEGDEKDENEQSQNEVYCNKGGERRRRRRRRRGRKHGDRSSSKFSFKSEEVEHVKSDFSDNGNIGKDDNMHEGLLHVARDVIENNGFASKSVQSEEASFLAIDEQIVEPKVIIGSASACGMNVAEICNKNDDALDNLETVIPVRKLLEEEGEDLTVSNKLDASNEVAKAVSFCSTENDETTAQITGSENSEIQVHSVFVVDVEEKSQPGEGEERQAAARWGSLQAVKSTSASDSSTSTCDGETSDKMIKSDGKKQVNSACEILQERRKSEQSETIFERDVDIEVHFNVPDDDDDDKNLKNDSSSKSEKTYSRTEKMETEIVRTVEIHSEHRSEENASSSVVVVAAAAAEPSVEIGSRDGVVQVELPRQAEELSSVLGNEIACDSEKSSSASNDGNCSSDPSVFARSQLVYTVAALPHINQESNACGGETCDEEHTTATEIDSDEPSVKSKENENATEAVTKLSSGSLLRKSISCDQNNVGKYFAGQDGISSPPMVSSLLEVVGATSVTQAVDKLSTLEAISDVMRRAGLESSNLIFGIDYTASNKYQGENSFDHKSLHTIDSVIQNPYQQVLSLSCLIIIQVITIMGKTLAPFSNGGTISAFGFGDVYTSDMSVFPLKKDGECHSFEEVLNVYNTITPEVILCGPTNFAPLIHEATKICKKVKTYHILVIVADGQVTNEKATRDAIVSACKYPLSIIVVGVGDGPWDMMRAFDESLPKRKWDNFHFVNFHQVTSNSSQPELAFVLEALLEIPNQYKKIKSLGLLDFDIGESKRPRAVMIGMPKLPMVYDYQPKYSFIVNTIMRWVKAEFEIQQETISTMLIKKKRLINKKTIFISMQC
ncbi:Copine family protein 2 [Trichinella spiralis]|uniref:Copine family protein 2 n=1 Tax=Trichinella spiralis TaxID=6334 RepID=A0A0V1B164_TRISP|nr:Copine family protein 2 [Trichinella spiralis]